MTPNAANPSLVMMCSMHLLKAPPNAGKYLDLSIERLDCVPWQHGLFLGNTYGVKDGHVMVPDAPGCGVEVTPDGLERAKNAVSEMER